MATYDNMCTYAKPSDIVARFIFDRRHFSRENNKAKFGAFLPGPKCPNELSVNVIGGLTEGEIWNIPTRTDKALKARADLAVNDITSINIGEATNLQVLIDKIPNKEHANIINIPSEKSKERLVAIKLADKSKLRLR